ncbi:hypothetical protein EDC01DRAFT_11215 [Geopyxis carbonaria]|nr:hypothetical protein EDC01DRAFT_11215 [Geopyxis carbonaria]
MLQQLIDFGVFLNGDHKAKHEIGKAVTEGFKTSGFIYLKNHGIPKETIEHVFSESASFFARPQEQKDTLGWYSPKANRGYVVQGREKVTELTDKTAVDSLRAKKPDLKESMEIGRDDQPETPNNWPSDDAGSHFRTTMNAFFSTCAELHLQVLEAIALGLELPDEYFFNSYCSAAHNTLRLLHYPPAPAELFKAGQVRAGKHTDYGTITLLFQDAAGGLQVRSPKKTWVNATPIPDTIVINAGDLLARWSNDRIRSTEHRVVQPPGEPKEGENWPARYSCAYFCNPDADAWIEALPGTYSEEDTKKYEGVNSGEYLERRLDSTYS